MDHPWIIFGMLALVLGLAVAGCAALIVLGTEYVSEWRRDREWRRLNLTPPPAKDTAA